MSIYINKDHTVYVDKINENTPYSITIHDLNNGNNVVDNISMDYISSAEVFKHTINISTISDFKVSINDNTSALVKSFYFKTQSNEIELIKNSLSGLTSNYIGTNVKLNINFPEDFVAGGESSEDVLEVTGITDSRYTTINGEYTKWGMRSFSSDTDSSPDENYPMWVNGVHAIYAIANPVTSGAEPTDDYEFQISAANRYAEMTDETDVSIAGSGREIASINKVVFTGTGNTLQIVSGDVMHTSSSYSSVSSSDIKVGEINFATKTTKANYTVQVTDHITNEIMEVKGELVKGNTANEVAHTIANRIVNEVNAANKNHGHPWTVVGDGVISTNQPIEDLFGWHLHIENTDGIGSDPTISVTSETLVYPEAPPTSILTEEQSNTLNRINVNTLSIKYKTDEMIVSNEGIVSDPDYSGKLL